MFSLFSRWTFIFIFMGTLLSPTFAAAASFKGSIKNDMKRHHINAVSIALIENTEIKELISLGQSETTPFTTQSAAELISSLSALITFRQEKLSLDEDINKLLTSKKLSDNALTEKQPVTLRLLLQHQSGIAQTENETVVIKEPGVSFEYSPINFTLVQQILTDRYQQPFQSVADNLILKPLALNHSKFDENTSPISFSTTAEDIAKLVIALENSLAGENHSVVPQTVALQLVSPDKLPNWGLGIEVNLNKLGEPVKQGDYFGQRGCYEGKSFLWLGNKENGLGLVILADANDNSLCKNETFIKNLVKSITAPAVWG